MIQKQVLKQISQNLKIQYFPGLFYRLFSPLYLKLRKKLQRLWGNQLINIKRLRIHCDFNLKTPKPNISKCYFFDFLNLFQEKNRLLDTINNLECKLAQQKIEFSDELITAQTVCLKCLFSFYIRKILSLALIYNLINLKQLKFSPRVIQIINQLNPNQNLRL